MGKKALGVAGVLGFDQKAVGGGNGMRVGEASFGEPVFGQVEGDFVLIVEVGWQLKGNMSRGSNLAHPNQSLGWGAGLGVLGARCSVNRFQCLDQTSEEGVGLSSDGPRPTSLIWRPKGGSVSEGLVVFVALKGLVVEVQHSSSCKDSDAQWGFIPQSLQVMGSRERLDSEGSSVPADLGAGVLLNGGAQAGVDGSSFKGRASATGN